MRKLLFFLFAAALLFGCQGQEGPMGPMGIPGEGTNWDVTEWTVSSNQWKLNGTVNGGNSYYYCELVDPKLTPFIASSGNVAVYLYTNTTSSGRIQTPLPYVSHYTDGKAAWTETYDFDFAPGSIVVYVKYSDFNTATVPPTRTFRVVKTW